MIISGGSDAVRCKMFMGTFTGTAIQWFSGLPDDHMTSFTQSARLFREQFNANRIKPPRPILPLQCALEGRGDIEGLSEPVLSSHCETPNS